MTRILKFSKMHGLGNDFVVIDTINQSVEITPSQIHFLADRRFGIGCDQLLLVEKTATAGADFKYRIFNSDGSEVAQCGNGVRCFARFVTEKGLTDKGTIAVETESGIVYPSLQKNGEVKVDMGLPRLDPTDVPFVSDEQADSYELSLTNGQNITIGVVSMGNPHAIMLVEDVATAAVTILGPLIESHADFPERVNAGFMEVVNREQIKLRVYERGVGETQACGTGACAAVVSGIQRGLLSREVQVSLPGGKLHIIWPADDQAVRMTGPATHVFDGEIEWQVINQH